MAEHFEMLRRGAVIARYGKPVSSLYRDIELGLFPRGVPIGKKSVAWPAHECDAVVRALVAGHSEHDIRALVKRLMAARRDAVGEQAEKTTSRRATRP